MPQPRLKPDKDQQAGRGPQDGWPAARSCDCGSIEGSSHYLAQCRNRRNLKLFGYVLIGRAQQRNDLLDVIENEIHLPPVAATFVVPSANHSGKLLNQEFSVALPSNQNGRTSDSMNCPIERRRLYAPVVLVPYPQLRIDIAPPGMIHIPNLAFANHLVAN